MGILTFTHFANGSTVFFDEVIMNPKFVRLISLSVYNSWDNFDGGIISEKNADGTTNKVTVGAGFYTIGSFVKTLKAIYRNHSKIKVNEDLSTAKTVFSLTNSDSSNLSISLSDEFSKVFTITSVDGGFRFEKKEQDRSKYFVHCDLVDKSVNIFNGKKSNILAFFNVKGKPYEKVLYEPPAIPMRPAEKLDYVDNIRLWIKDSKGENFDFENFHIDFEIEII